MRIYYSAMIFRIYYKFSGSMIVRSASLMDIRKFGGQTRTLSIAANEPNTAPEATEVSESGDILSNSREGFLRPSRLLSTDNISVESCLVSSTTVADHLACVSIASIPSDLTTPLNDIDKWKFIMKGPSQLSNSHFPRRKYSNGNLSFNPT